MKLLSIAVPCYNSEKYMQKCIDSLLVGGEDVEILIVNKSDTIDSRDIRGAIYVSAKTGAGISELMHEIRNRIAEITNNGESTVMINARTYDLLITARDELFAALNDFIGDYEILSEHVRYAADAIGKILGTIGTAEILDKTFSQLCLGK